MLFWGGNTYPPTHPPPPTSALHQAPPKPGQCGRVAPGTQEACSPNASMSSLFVLSRIYRFNRFGALGKIHISWLLCFLRHFMHSRYCLPYQWCFPLVRSFLASCAPLVVAPRACVTSWLCVCVCVWECECHDEARMSAAGCSHLGSPRARYGVCVCCIGPCFLPHAPPCCTMAWGVFPLVGALVAGRAHQRRPSRGAPPMRTRGGDACPSMRRNRRRGA